jgi:3-hydroxyisobutyrate dehydrogenase-like beta-hydroxyacid dehydrogenase
MGQPILVVGLGNMGAALARSLMDASNEVIVWNRTAEKAAPLVANGARLAESVAQGIAASEVMVICVGNYDDTHSVLKSCGDLRGKTIIQLTSGAGSEISAMENWAIQKGARYLDGSIMAYPRDIGKDECVLLVAGSEDGWNHSREIIKQLGGASVYLGLNVSAPSALEAGLILPTLSAVIGMIQSTVLLDETDVSISEYVDMVSPSFTGTLADDFRRQGMAIANDQFDDTEASLKTWAAIVTHWVEAAEQDGLDMTFARAISDLLNKAVEAGYGDEELAAVVKVLR